MLSSALAWQAKEKLVQCEVSLTATSTSDTLHSAENTPSSTPAKANTLVSTSTQVAAAPETSSTQAPGTASKLKQKKKQIFFCSRTHTQLQQVVDELRTCPADYLTGLRMCILGSRMHLCINQKLTQRNEELKSKSFIDEECNKLLKVKACAHAKVLHGTREALLKLPVWDIEDAVRVGHKKFGCPYYATRGKADTPL